MNILTSRRFLTLLLDSAVSVVTYYFGGQDTLFLIGILQPIFVFIIASYTIEGTARIRQGLMWKE